MLSLLRSQSLALLWRMENVGLSGQRLMDLLLLHVTVKVSAFNGTMHFYRAINQTLKPNMTKQGTWRVFIMRKSAWRCVWCLEGSPPLHWAAYCTSCPLMIGGFWQALCLAPDDWSGSDSWLLVCVEQKFQNERSSGGFYWRWNSFMQMTAEMTSVTERERRKTFLIIETLLSSDARQHIKCLIALLYCIKQGDVYSTKTQLCFFQYAFYHANQ